MQPGTAHGDDTRHDTHSQAIPHILLAPEPGRESPIQGGGLKEPTPPPVQPPAAQPCGGVNGIVARSQEEDADGGDRAVFPGIQGEVLLTGISEQNGGSGLKEEECGACLGRHRRHNCGRERLSDIDPLFKDENCAACMGRHRPHTCKKGKPEHLRKTIRRRKSQLSGTL